MGRLLKYLAVLIVLALAGLVIYALVGDLSAPTRELRQSLPPPGGGG